MTSAEAWDVAVAGAGPAGSVLATVLARAGRRVVLVDPLASDLGKAPQARSPKVGETLPAVARPLLRDLRLLQRVEAGPHLPSYGTVSAWGSPELRATDALRDPHGTGWHLDRARFDGDLRRAAREEGVTLLGGRVRSVDGVAGRWRLRVDDDDETLDRCRWIVDATGRHSAVARSLGVGRRRDDRLVALCVWAGPGGSEDGRTLVESVPEGWWYTARLPGARRVVVLHVDGESAAPILRTEGEWSRRLAATEHVRRAVGEAEIVVGPRATEACGARLDRFAGDGWLAVGDAALSFDPLSSQGLLDALYTGLRGAQAVGAALNGDPRPVAAYGERLEAVRAAYLRHHGIYYGSERRWRGRSFWRRRNRRTVPGESEPSS